jgi:hypothetical protein
MIRESSLKPLLGTAALLSIAATSKVTTYSQAQAAFHVQQTNSQRTSYLAIWDPRNRVGNLLQEKENCYLKANGSSRNILFIDASGTVVQIFSDPEIEMADCFRHSLIGMKFPKPPYAPLYIHLDMGDSEPIRRATFPNTPAPRK